MSHKMITLDQAKNIAEKAISDDCAKAGIICLPPNLLEEEVIDTPGCWLILRNKKISFPEGNWYSANYGAYAISKFGEFSQITHFDYDASALLEYSKKMSDYFLAKTF